MRIATLGDSHALFSFAGVRSASLMWRGPVTMHRAARDGIASLLPQGFSLQRDDILILSFGEIDARVHIPAQALKSTRTVEVEVDALCARFAAAVQSFSATQPCRLALACIVPATYNFSQMDHAYTDTATFNREQTLIRTRMNGHLAAMGLPFIDFRAGLTDSVGMMIQGRDDGNCHLGGHSAALSVQAINATFGAGTAEFRAPPGDVFLLAWPSTVMTRLNRRVRLRIKSLKASVRALKG